MITLALMAGRPEPPWVPVGTDGIAEYLGVSENTVRAWRQRSAKAWVRVARFPEPAGQIAGRDWWWLADIIEWAKKTNRLPRGS